MKRIYPGLFLFLAVIITVPAFAQNNNVGIGTTTPAPSAALDVTSTTQGMLVPRLTTAQRTGIASPAQGLLVYDTNLGCFYYYNSTAWISLCQAGPAGPTGAAGTPGATGPSGLNGVTGPSGNDGVTGPSGADGATGLQGVPGASGTDGTTGATGPTGPIGPGGAGSLGPTGANGSTGPTGPQGVPGVTGPSGANGAPGIAGPTGVAGTPGTPGTAGTPGATGPAGVTGPTGAGSGLNIQSISLTANTNLNATTFTNLPGITLSIVPTQSKTFVEFTASGFGTQNAAGIAYFQILVNGTAVGGSFTMSSVTDDYDGYTLFGWSSAITKMVTVTPNVTNTITVQYYSSAVLGGTGLAIDPTNAPNHATLTAFVQ